MNQSARSVGGISAGIHDSPTVAGRWSPDIRSFRRISTRDSPSSLWRLCMSLPQGTECLNLTVPSRPTPAPFFFYPASRGHIVGIFEGRTYPIVKDVGTVRTIVDIGANVGAASVMLAARYPGADVHSFEPGPAAAAVLAWNAGVFPQIHVHPFGLGNADGQLQLFRSRWDPMSASILRSAENTESFDVVEIREAMRTLKSLGITAIDILKIDTEGCEVPLLKCLAQFLPDIKIIYMEYHSETDRLRMDELLASTHVLGFATVRHPHRGDVCYVHRRSEFIRHYDQLAIISPSRGR